MDFTDFMNDAEAITNRLKSRTPPNTANAINAALAGGEFSIAVKELIFSLTKHRIAITAAERDTLARLTEYLEESQFTDMVLALELDPDARP